MTLTRVSITSLAIMSKFTAVQPGQGAISDRLEFPLCFSFTLPFRNSPQNGLTINNYFMLPPKWGRTIVNLEPFFSDTLFEMVR